MHIQASPHNKNAIVPLSAHCDPTPCTICIRLSFTREQLVLQTLILIYVIEPQLLCLKHTNFHGPLRSLIVSSATIRSPPFWKVTSLRQAFLLNTVVHGNLFNLGSRLFNHRIEDPKTVEGITNGRGARHSALVAMTCTDIRKQ